MALVDGVMYKPKTWTVVSMVTGSRTYSLTAWQNGVIYTLGIYIKNGGLIMQASVFKSNKSQAVRLPKQVAFPEEVKRVDVVVIGRSRMLTPTGEIWDAWFDAPPLPSDFMIDREQPLAQERDVL